MADISDHLISLTRGGVLIPAVAGNIQYGIPPETIKDTMNLPGGVPHTYIVPRFMFDLESGLALAEMEFPVYFNYFVKNRKTRIICTKKQQKRIKTVISEAMFGPQIIDHAREFADGENTPGYGDLKAEMDSFKKHSPGGKGSPKLSDLLEFYLFDDQGIASCDGVSVRLNSHHDMTVFEQGKQIAFIDRDRPVMLRRSAVTDYKLRFRPPLFGITTLGAGHGFDPKADTSGLIIWVNRRGVMVDPPVNSTEKLLALGVSPKWIDNIILTHCHADHDAGTLQKILQEGKVSLYTTETIYRSFMKKAAALTGIEEFRLKRLVRFSPVCIGTPMIIGGGRFNFSYTLHSIPTISIQASLHGKSMVYSSDTMNDPAYIDQLYAEGVLTKTRRDFLIDFPWDRDVIFHEAGIPPIHTPLDYLCSLPEAIRKKIYLVHVNPEMIPCESGLRVAPTGLANTIDLDIKAPPHDEAVEMLDAFGRVELFQNLLFEKAREFLLIAEVEHHRASDVIFGEGDAGDKFYVIMSGEVDIVLDGRILTTYDVGGYFGEKSLFTDENRTATAVSRTDVKLLAIRKSEMLSLIRQTESESLLRHTADVQNVALRETLKHNPIFGTLSSTQQTHLHGLIRPYAHLFRPGETIAGPGTAPGFTCIVRDGKVEVRQGDAVIDTLTAGGLFGVAGVFKGREKKNFSFVAKDDTSLYCITHKDLKRYLDANPGVYVKMYHVLY